MPNLSSDIIIDDNCRIDIIKGNIIPLKSFFYLIIQTRSHCESFFIIFIHTNGRSSSIVFIQLLPCGTCFTLLFRMVRFSANVYFQDLCHYFRN